MNEHTFYRFRSLHPSLGNVEAFHRYSQVQPNNTTKWQYSVQRILNAFTIQHIHTKAKLFSYNAINSIVRRLLFPESGTLSSPFFISLCKHCNSIYCNQRTIDYHRTCDNHMIALSATIKREKYQSKCKPIKMYSLPNRKIARKRNATHEIKINMKL